MKNIMRKAIAKAINSILNPLDLEISTKTKGDRRMSMPGALNQIAELRFIPRTVIDVGAAFGDWSKMSYHFFPDARYFLFEPLREYKDVLNKMMSEFNNAQYLDLAVGSKNGTVILNVHEDLVGSSMFRETEGTFSDGKPRTVPRVMLDKIALDYDFRGPYLIKIDAQGAELEVLSGADKILEETEYIILEVSLFQFMIGGPQIFDVIKFMKEQGFVVYDVTSCLYRPLDNALAQLDLSFVKENGMFRKDHRYCTHKQREEQNKRFEEKNRKKLEMKELFDENVHFSFYTLEDSNSLKNKMLKLIKDEPYRMNVSLNSLKRAIEKYTVGNMKRQIQYLFLGGE
jgi:FkbM family methyltransferase